MTDEVCRLELLPNEMLIEIFQYIDTQDLFRGFFKLNSRFNALIQSLNNLTLTIATCDPDEINEYAICSPYIHTLILDHRANIDLNNFTNLRRLNLLSPTNEQCEELQAAALLSLEHLSIGYRRRLFGNCLSDPCKKIFSNGFPNLKTCSLLKQTVHISPYSIKPTQIRILKIKSVCWSNYQLILSACPNLYLFQFTPGPYDEPFAINRHTNLRRMIMILSECINAFNYSDIDAYFACVPNLEKIIVHGTNEDANIIEYLTYDWLATSVNRHLSSLLRFKYYFHVYSAEELIKYDSENILSSLDRKFKHVHNDRYESKLIFKLVPWSIVD